MAHSPALYNTLTKKVEAFTPIGGREVKMYTCGPSVYDHPHIGNFRTYVIEDALKRWFIHRGWKVKHVMPITDVDVKSLRRAAREGKSVPGLVKPYTVEFFGYVKALNLIPATYVHAGAMFPEMLLNIRKLMKKGFAYIDGNEIFFKLENAADYGILAGRKITPKTKQIRKSDYYPAEAADFLLFEKDFNCPRPSWHMHCATIGLKHLGSMIDLHMGGFDNLFSHHENTKALAEALTGKPYSRFWMHPRHLLVNNKKMSKSKGNYVTVSGLLAKYSPNAIRMFLLSKHYRKTLNLTEDAMSHWQKAWKKLETAYAHAKAVAKPKQKQTLGKKEKTKSEKLKTRFFSYLENDFRADKALGLLAENASRFGAKFFEEAFFIFGLRH